MPQPHHAGGPFFCLQVVRAGCSPQRGPGPGPGPGPVKPASPARVVAAFQRCTLELAPLLECLNLPMPHMSNFIEYQVGGGDGLGGGEAAG
jgi:hypothetical protein